MSIDPYGRNEPEKPSLRVNSIATLVFGAVFVLIGVGCLLAALIMGDAMLVPLGVVATGLGAVRVWLALR